MRGALHRWALACLLAATGCSTGTEEAAFDNPFDPQNAGSFPVPDSLTVLVGDNVARIAWRIEPGTGVDQFAVFRRRLDVEPAEDERLLAKVTSLFYEDRQVRTGRVYAYRVAAGSQGAFGERTEEVQARPAFFSLVLAAGAPYTRNATVTVTAVAPAGVEAIALAEVADLSEVTWRPTTTSVSWTLSDGDGPKSVFARFRLTDGSLSLPVQDDIVLDTRAFIREIDFTGAEVRAPGDVLHLRLDSGELEGVASASVAGVLNLVSLYDDGQGGDSQPGDGIYETDVVIPAVGAVSRAIVTGRFTDAAGNDAAPLVGPRALTVGEAPIPVSVLSTQTPEPPDQPAVILRWSQSLDPDFRSYRIYRDQDPQVDASDTQVGEVTNIATLEFRDTDVVEGRTYYYRVFIRNEIGLQSGSETVSVLVPNLRPPQTVTLQEPDGVSETRISLSWTKASSEDFAAYRVYRNDSGAVSEADPMVAEITNPDRLYFDDTGLRDNTLYHYRVFTVDTGGLTARSNEVEARTTNAPPPAVLLDEATDITSTSATLSWDASPVHDFSAYRLYRDTVSTVTASSTLVVELTERDATSFRDEDLSASTTYYYRVYVVDDGETPEPKQSGSNIVVVTTP